MCACVYIRKVRERKIKICKMVAFTSVSYQQSNSPHAFGGGGGQEFGGGWGSHNLRNFSKNVTAKLGLGTKKVLPKAGDAAAAAAKPKGGIRGKLNAVREGMKNKSFSDIKANAPDAKTYKKEMAKEISKRVLKTAAKGGIAAGMEVGMGYGYHLLSGGDAFTSAEMKNMATDAGVSIADKVLKQGGVGEEDIRREMVNSYNRAIKAKGGRPTRDFEETLAKAAKLNRRLDATHSIRHKKIHNSNVKPFGGGGKRGGRAKTKKKKKTTVKRGGKQKRSTRGKKKSIKKKKSAKTKKKGKSGGRRKNVNILNSAVANGRIRDVFDY